MSSSNNRGGVSASPSAVVQNAPAEKFATSPAKKKALSEAEKFQAMKEELSKKKGPLHVMATRSGIYPLGVRRVEGDKFTIEDIDDFGKWMKPI